MISATKGFGSLTLGHRSAPAFARPVTLSLAYLDDTPLAVEQAIARRKGSLNILNKTTTRSIRKALDERFAAMAPQSLMEHTKERLAKQVSDLKESLEARYGKADEAAADDLPPGDRGRSLANYAISLFSGFLERSSLGENAKLGEGEAVRDDYVGMMRQAIDDGFAEARGVYEGLNQMDSELGARIDETFKAVRKRLDAFAKGSS
jgi:hypothetical protein